MGTSQKRKSLYDRLPPVPCKNNSGSNTIPAFGLVYVAGQDATTGALLVDRPNADNQDVFINGPSPIPPNAYGTMYRPGCLFAAYNTGATPAIGQTWGAAAGSYLLTSGKAGLLVQSNPASGRVLVVIKYS